MVKSSLLLFRFFFLFPILFLFELFQQNKIVKSLLFSRVTWIFFCPFFLCSFIFYLVFPIHFIIGRGGGGIALVRRFLTLSHTSSKHVNSSRLCNLNYKAYTFSTSNLALFETKATVPNIQPYNTCSKENSKSLRYTSWIIWGSACSYKTNEQWERMYIVYVCGKREVFKMGDQKNLREITIYGECVFCLFLSLLLVFSSSRYVVNIIGSIRISWTHIMTWL